MSQKSLILLHGALGNVQQFDQLKKFLSQKVDVYSFTFEGHGGVESTGSFSMDNFTENVVDFMEVNGIKNTSIFGYSMGGYVGLTMALNHPEKVERVVTLGTKFDWTSDFSAMEVKKLNPEKIEEKVPRFAKHLQEAHSPLDWKEVVRNTAKMMQNLGETNPLKENYSKITSPTLITLGTLDKMSTEKESREVANQIENGHFELIPDFEHSIEKVNHSKLAQLINNFILID